MRSVLPVIQSRKIVEENVVNPLTARFGSSGYAKFRLVLAIKVKHAPQSFPILLYLPKLLIIEHGNHSIS